MKQKKKLIEVSLPLDAINAAAAREKSIRHGHPSTLHLWWARRPLAAARAVIFAQMVDDPSTYIDELRGDGKLKRRANAKLKARRKVWQQAVELYEKAQYTTANLPEPGPEPTLDEALADLERERLFAIIEELVKWENTNNEKVLQQARDEIWQSWRRACAENADHPNASELFNRHQLPAFHDPFAGGGALPLEAQRLGLESYASDLNPVAVMINKAMIEIPPRFAGQRAVGPIPAGEKEQKKLDEAWPGASGLAEDVRRYGHWMREQARKKIGHLYPKVSVSAAMAAERPDLEPYVGQELTVIAWLWTRTVKCPNPACGCEMPLLSSFTLSSKKGKEAYLLPSFIDGRLSFKVSTVFDDSLGDAKKGYKRGMSGIFECINCGSVTTRNYTAEQATTNGLGAAQTAVVCEGTRGRVYLSASASPLPDDIPRADTTGLEIEMSPNPRDVWCRNFGLDTPADLFTARQLVALTTFSDLVAEARERVIADARDAGMVDDGAGIDAGGSGAPAYGDAVATLLAFSVDKMADLGNSLVRWEPIAQCPRQLFGRQAIPMVWDFAEANPFSKSSGSWMTFVDGQNKSFSKSFQNVLPWFRGNVQQADASNQNHSEWKVVSTDPPYYDNIGYADLSDFFYVWMRRSLRSIYPGLFATMAVPKAEELVATSYRHGSKDKAETFFMGGMTQAIHNMADKAHPAFPVTIYYAFKQAETQEGSTASTGWETFLEAVIRAGFSIDGTWPMRTENSSRMVSQGTNALASSVVLVCRARSTNLPDATRREFFRALKAELPDALTKLQAGNIAPVDLAQAAIGPGMAIFTRYGRVVDAEGNPLSVRTALSLINQVLDEVMAAQEGDFDADTRWALAWFEQYGFEVGDYGVAETLSKAKNTAVEGLEAAGIIAMVPGKVRILKPSELLADWDPESDSRLTVWEMVHHLIRVLESGGESAAAALVAKLGSHAETARELCYRLYTVCERKSRSADAIAYNSLVQSWPEISRLAREAVTSTPTPTNRDLFE